MDATELAILLASGDGKNYRPAPKIRTPLPPFPPGDYDRDFAAQYPNGYPVGIEYWAGNPWSVEVPNAPPVPGGCESTPTRCLTYLINRYTRDFRENIYTAHAERGLTHFTVSPPDSLYGPSACSLSELVDICGRIKEWFYVDAILASKDYCIDRPTLQQFADLVGPVLEALLDADVLDIATVAWEYNLFNTPGKTAQQIHDWVRRTIYAKRPTVRLAQHFGVGATYWGSDFPDPPWLPTRSEWWAYFNQPLFDNGRQVASGFTFLKYQGLCEWQDGTYQWDVKMRQDRARDTTDRPDIVAPKVFVYWEADAQEQFYRLYPSEDDSDLFAYLMLPTRGQRIHGGQGGRLPDGRWLSYPNLIPTLPR